MISAGGKFTKFVISKVLAACMRKLITARARKNKCTARMLANARKDHSIPLLWSNFWYPFFYIFVHSGSSLDILRNFNLLRSIERTFFSTFIFVNLTAAAINFPCSSSWLKIGVNKVMFSKYGTDWNYNNNKSGLKIALMQGPKFLFFFVRIDVLVVFIIPNRVVFLRK